MVVAFILPLTVQYCGLITLPVLWLVFVTFYVSHVMYCITIKKLYILKIRTCIEILA